MNTTHDLFCSIPSIDKKTEIIVKKNKV